MFSELVVGALGGCFWRLLCLRLMQQGWHWHRKIFSSQFRCISCRSTKTPNTDGLSRLELLDGHWTICFLFSSLAVPQGDGLHGVLGRLCKFVGFFSQIVPSLRRARDRVNHGNVFLLWSLAMLFELRILRV